MSAANIFNKAQVHHYLLVMIHAHINTYMYTYMYMYMYTHIVKR